MNRCFFSLVTLLAALSCLTWSHNAHAAEGYANCTGFITSIPTLISTQGVWCLNQNLSMAASSGTAITIENNNVTIDCNGFSITGSGGAGTLAGGIYAGNRSNITVRHCAIGGFYYGVQLIGDTSSSGHVVEDNRFDANTVYGPTIQGDGSVVRRNLIINTGPSTITAFAKAIVVQGSVDVLDNTISGVTTASGSNGYTFAIQTYNDPDGRVSGNIVRGLAPDGSGTAAGVAASASPNLTIRGNDLEGNGGYGLSCDAVSDDIARDNIILGFGIAISLCDGDGSNYSSP